MQQQGFRPSVTVIRAMIVVSRLISRKHAIATEWDKTLFHCISMPCKAPLSTSNLQAAKKYTEIFCKLF